MYPQTALRPDSPANCMLLWQRIEIRQQVTCSDCPVWFRQLQHSNSSHWQLSQHPNFPLHLVLSRLSTDNCFRAAWEQLLLQEKLHLRQGRMEKLRVCVVAHATTHLATCLQCVVGTSANCCMRAVATQCRRLWRWLHPNSQHHQSYCHISTC